MDSIPSISTENGISGLRSDPDWDNLYNSRKTIIPTTGKINLFYDVMTETLRS